MRSIPRLHRPRRCVPLFAGATTFLLIFTTSCKPTTDRRPLFPSIRFYFSVTYPPRGRAPRGLLPTSPTVGLAAIIWSTACGALPLQQSCLMCSTLAIPKAFRAARRFAEATGPLASNLLRMIMSVRTVLRLIDEEIHRLTNDAVLAVLARFGQEFDPG